jgi:gas vesicle protein
MGNNRSAKFSAGLIIGAVIGGLSAFLLSPKAGKENRKLLMKKFKELQDSLGDLNVKEKAEEIFGEVSEEGMKMYKTAKKDLAKRLEDVKDQVEDFDQEKYTKMVEDVMEDVKTQMKASGKHVEKLRGYLLENWNKIAENDGTIDLKKKTHKKKS